MSALRKRKSNPGVPIDNTDYARIVDYSDRKDLPAAWFESYAKAKGERDKKIRTGGDFAIVEKSMGDGRLTWGVVPWEALMVTTGVRNPAHKVGDFVRLADSVAGRAVKLRVTDIGQSCSRTLTVQPVDGPNWDQQYVVESGEVVSFNAVRNPVYPTSPKDALVWEVLRRKGQNVGMSNNPEYPSSGDTFAVAVKAPIKVKSLLTLHRHSDGRTFMAQVQYMDRNGEELTSIHEGMMANPPNTYAITIQANPVKAGKTRYIPNKDVTYVLKGVNGYAYTESLRCEKVTVYDEAADIAKYRNPLDSSNEGNIRQAGRAVGEQWNASSFIVPGFDRTQKEFKKAMKGLGIPVKPSDAAAGAPMITAFIEGMRETYKRGKRNPEDTAADVYEMFHGKPSDQVTEYRFLEHEHSNFAGLGELVNLRFITPFGKEVIMNAPDPDSAELTQIVQLCCSEDRTQLYFVGGDQAISEEGLKKMGFTDENDFKDLMLLGVLCEVTYRTEKGFDKFKLTDYYHELGEESGVEPVLLYDFRSGLMRVAGGQYRIEDVGICN